ncbi:sensor histidine kinase [Occultella aeris]|uniref:histidine kinase n=1 Tax=Occultella aeris TaxID=2761496 RepID=A0A7M4DPW0_9MICO|nr:Sensor histidine kinase DesK [Occultella aeris]
MCGRAGVSTLGQVPQTDRPVLHSRVWLVAGGVIVALVLVLSTVGVDPPFGAMAVLLGAAVFATAVLAWALWRARQERRAFEDELTAWAAERAAQAERLRIARDLHDLASHGLGLITVRAAAARTVAGPAAATERATALADIERTARGATTELRRMLSVLRTPGEGAPLRPAETLADLPRIVADARAGGVEAALEIADLGEVSAGTQLALCAIVREGLTNTARHAGPTAARVLVSRAGETVLATVTDDGPAPGWAPHPGAGAGIAGLRERVDALGGTLLGERVGGGYRLTARLPEPVGPAGTP